MSAIRITHGAAEVTVEGLERMGYEYASATVIYSPDDLIAATVSALRAMPQDKDSYGISGRVETWLRAIYAGAATEGLEIRE